MASARANVCVARAILTPEVRITVREASSHTAVHQPAYCAEHVSVLHQLVPSLTNGNL